MLQKVTIVYAQCIPLEIVSEALTSTFYLNDFEDVSFHDGIRRSRELNIVPLLSHLSEGERVVADLGYRGEAPQQVKCPGSAYSTEETVTMQSKARARHETMNKRLKQWGCLFHQYRHSLSKHGDVFRAVAVITQLSFRHDTPLYQVEYNETRTDGRNA